MGILFFFKKRRFIMIKKTKRNPRNNKKYGSSWERDSARLLSVWLFEDENVLKRHPTSGAEKSISASDIIPMKNIDIDFTVHIECKNGYETEIDIFKAKQQLIKWYNEAIEKLKNKNETVWIIWKIPRRGILLCSNKSFVNVEEMYTMNDLTIYDFKKILESDAKESFLSNYIKEI